MNEKVAELIAQETMARICQEGLLDLARLSPGNVKEVQTNIQSAIFLGMSYMREACARKIEEGLSNIPEGMPSFVAAQAEEALRSLAEAIRATTIPMDFLKTSPLKRPLEYRVPTREEIEAATKEATNELLQRMGSQPPVQYPPGHAKVARGASSEFECHWCKEAGLPEAEYTKQGNPASTDFYGRPLCKECTDRLEPPPKRTPPAS